MKFFLIFILIALTCSFGYAQIVPSMQTTNLGTNAQFSIMPQAGGPYLYFVGASWSNPPVWDDLMIASLCYVNTPIFQHTLDKLHHAQPTVFNVYPPKIPSLIGANIYLALFLYNTSTGTVSQSYMATLLIR